MRLIGSLLIAILVVIAVYFSQIMAAGDKDADSDKESSDGGAIIENKTITSDSSQEITWDELMPPGYDPYSIVEKYQEELNQYSEFEENSPGALEVYSKIQAELDNAPVNPAIDGKNIRMPGFIAPLENENGLITEFLLVPYFGACIHVPPPPINQTVMVTADDGQGVKSEESYLPIWIEGTMSTVEFRTDIGVAGYTVNNARISPYTLEDETQ